MTKKLALAEIPARKFYRVKVRIQSDTLQREHRPGSIADLTDWPEDALKAYEAQGDIESCLTEECEDG